MEGQESIPRVVPEGKSLRKESEHSSQASLASGSPFSPEKGPGGLLTAAGQHSCAGNPRPVMCFLVYSLAENDISVIAQHSPLM